MEINNNSITLMMTIIIKPTPEKFYIAAFSVQKTEIVLKRIVYAYGKDECISFLKTLPEQDIEDILFDGTVYMQDGVDIRTETDLPVRISKKTGKAKDRINAQKEWLCQANIVYNEEMENDTDYMRFISHLDDYDDPDVENPDPTAADLMADAARHFRRNA